MNLPVISPVEFPAGWQQRLACKTLSGKPSGRAGIETVHLNCEFVAEFAAIAD